MRMTGCDYSIIHALLDRRARYKYGGTPVGDGLFFLDRFFFPLPLLLLSPARKSGSAIFRYVVSVRCIREDALPR